MFIFFLLPDKRCGTTGGGGVQQAANRGLTVASSLSGKAGQRLSVYVPETAGELLKKKKISFILLEGVKFSAASADGHVTQGERGGANPAPPPPSPTHSPSMDSSEVNVSPAAMGSQFLERERT